MAAPKWASARTGQRLRRPGASRSGPISTATSAILWIGTGAVKGVVVSFVLDRTGHVSRTRSPKVRRSAFDAAAMDMIRRSDPVPHPPAKLTDDEFNYSLDVNFKGE